MQSKLHSQIPNHRPIQSPTEENSLSMQPAFIVKIYINPKMQTEINLNTNSDIDTVIRSCINKYNLKKEAHSYLKKQIEFFMEKSVCKTESDEVSRSIDDSLGFDKKTSRKKSFVLKDLKAGDIALNKITIQKTPKNAENSFFKKEKSTFKTSKLTQNNPKIFLTKNNDKENSNELSFQFKSLTDFKKIMDLPEKKISQNTEKLNQKQKQTPLREKKMNENKHLKTNLFNQNLANEKKDRKLKTESDLDTSTKMREFSLFDLENEMNEQVTQLKYEKKTKSIESELCSLFHSLIRYNPPKISRIDLRYVCFEDITEELESSLRTFLLSLSEDELSSLDFCNFKKLLIKYRCDALLSCLK